MSPGRHWRGILKGNEAGKAQKHMAARHFGGHAKTRKDMATAEEGSTGQRALADSWMAYPTLGSNGRNKNNHVNDIFALWTSSEMARNMRHKCSGNLRTVSIVREIDGTYTIGTKKPCIMNISRKWLEMVFIQITHIRPFGSGNEAICSSDTL